MTPKPGLFTVSRLGAQGAGIADTADGPVHLAQALPGEMHRVAPDGTVTLEGQPSPHRRALALCPHVAACGGCAVQHLTQDAYRNWKEALLGDALASRGLDVAVAPMQWVGPASRRRAGFSGRWQDGQFVLGFHGWHSHRIEAIRECAVLAPAIVTDLPAVSAIAERICPRAGEVRVAVLAARNGLDVAMETSPRGKRGADTAAMARLAAGGRVIRLTVDGAPAFQVAEPIVDIAGVAVVPPPGAFLQAAADADTLIADLVAPALAKARSVVDLFAGLGTLSLRLARRSRVLAVDSDRSLSEALGRAVRHARGLRPLATLVRDLYRDPLSSGELDAFDAVVLDPPRAGARAQAEVLARSKVKTVVMVSCNPATLARDLRALVDGRYAIESATPIDQFLYTAHLEAVVVLRR